MSDLSITNLILSNLIIMCAAGLQVLTGFGFCLVSIPLLLFIFPGYEAIFISLTLSSLMLFFHARKYMSDIRWDLVWRLVVIGIPGLLLGVIFGGKLDAVYLKGVVGITIINNILMQWIQLIKNRQYAKATSAISVSEFEKAPTHREMVGEERKNNKNKGFYFAGFLSGILTGAVGLPGPPVVAILISLLPKEKFHATLIPYFIINNILALGLAIWVFQRQSLTRDDLYIIIILLIPVFLGYFMGQFMNRFINESRFQRMVYSLLIVVGMVSIMESVLRVYNVWSGQ